MSKINTSVCFRVHNYDQYLELCSDLRAMGYKIDGQWNQYVMNKYPRFKGLYLHIETDFTVCLHDHTLGAEVVPNFECIVNELPQQPKGKAA